MSNRRQPQRLPPPITHGAEPIDSAIVLREYRGELGLSLWKTVRTVRLWAEVPETERSRAFGGGAHGSRLGLLKSEAIPEEVRGSLGKVAAVLQPRARSGTVAAGCRRIAAWAEGQGALGTAIEYLQAAAAALPMDAELAHEVARVARDRGEYPRAETWFRHAVSRARRSQNRYEFSRSYLGLGSVYLARGSYQQARRNLIRGLRAAKRFSIRPLAAVGYHELAVLAIRSERPAEVGRYTRAAIEAYSPGDPGLKALATEVAGFLIDSGLPAEARRILESVPDEAGGSPDRLRRIAGIARAAALTGDCAAYTSAWDEAEGMIGEDGAPARNAAAMLALGQAAAVAGQVDRAGRTARLARQQAATAGEEQVEREAAELLKALEGGREIERPTIRTAPPKVLGLVRAIEVALS